MIREEELGDHGQVARLHRQAFAHGDVVVRLVAALRQSLEREPGLSLVAVDDDATVVGHALFTRSLLDAPQKLVDVQVLSPLGVLPDRQGAGVGSALVRSGLQTLDQRGAPLVFLEGSPDYYSRFGFERCRERGVRRPSLRIPDGGFQVRLLSSYEPWMTGTLVYRPEFWHHDLVGLREVPRDPARPSSEPWPTTCSTSAGTRATTRSGPHRPVGGRTG